MLDGDEWVINGQKVWTTQGHHADYCFLLTRTDPDAPKHKGISYLLVPMRQPGVEVRGITQPDGTAEFCEVFFTDARCPKDNVVGGVNNGWKVANSTLAFERGQSATTGYRRFEEEYRLLRRGGHGRTVAIADPHIRQRLMQYYTKIQILRINGLRTLSSALTGSKDPGVDRARRDATRCSGRRCTSGRWSWRSTSTAPSRCSSTPARRRARGRARCATSAATAIR